MSQSARLIYKTRSDLAMKKISLEEARQNIDRVVLENKILINNSIIEKKIPISSTRLRKNKVIAVIL